MGKNLLMLIGIAGVLLMAFAMGSVVSLTAGGYYKDICILEANND